MFCVQNADSQPQLDHGSPVEDEWTLVLSVGTKLKQDIVKVQDNPFTIMLTTILISNTYRLNLKHEIEAVVDYLLPN